MLYIEVQFEHKTSLDNIVHTSHQTYLENDILNKFGILYMHCANIQFTILYGQS